MEILLLLITGIGTQLLRDIRGQGVQQSRSIQRCLGEGCPSA
jgi:hypothetical protein